jgi:hypothetical protein
MAREPKSNFRLLKAFLLAAVASERFRVMVEFGPFLA